MISIERILLDGALFTLAMSVLVLLSLLVNPRIWLNDYPAEIRQRAAPLAAGEKRVRMCFSVVFIVAFFIIPYLSTRALAEEAGKSVSFFSLYLHAFVLFNLFNLFDAVVIDWLFLGIVHPRFALIPEAWGRTQYLLNARTLVGDWLKGIGFCVVGALIIAGAVRLVG